MLSWCWYDSTPLTFYKSNKPYYDNSKCYIYLWISSSRFWFWDRSHAAQAYHVTKDDLELWISFFLLPVAGIRVWGLSPILCLQSHDNKASQTSRTKTTKQTSHPIKRTASYQVNSLPFLHWWAFLTWKIIIVTCGVQHWIRLVVSSLPQSAESII